MSERKKKTRNVNDDDDVVVIKKTNSDNPDIIVSDTPKSREIINKERREAAIIQRNADMSDTRFKLVYDAIKNMVVGQQFNIRQFTIMVPLAMQTLSDVYTMDGPQKKDLIVRVFKYLIEELTFETPEQQDLARHFVDNDLETLIDTAYLASKGKFEFSDTATETYDISKFNLVYDNIKKMIVNKTIDIQTILILLPTVMIQVGRFVNLTGLQKKDMVIQIITKLLDEFKPDDETYALILTFIKNQLPYVIEIIYQSSIGSYIYKKIQSWTSCWACCKKQ
jgi:hypothetical protein